MKKDQNLECRERKKMISKIVKDEAEMLNFGENIAKKIVDKKTTRAKVIELVGDVGAGKTTFTRGLAKGLGVKEAVTSPSFTISKTYAFLDGGHLVHYDFYRLNDPGLMVGDLEENLHNSKNVVVIEWGESIAEILPKRHLRVEIKYNEDGTRTVNCQATGGEK